MLYSKQAVGSIDQVSQKLVSAATENKFGVLGMHDLKSKMAEKGVGFESECRIFEVCNPTQAKRVLETNMLISTALPCRISIYEEGGKVTVAMLRPTALLALFENAQLESVAQDVEQTMVRIIDAACK